MKVGIMTGIDALDKELNSSIQNSKIAYYSKYFLEDTNIEIAILSYTIKCHLPFKDFIFELRKRNIRVILLLDNKDSPYLGYALALGINDIIFDPINKKEILLKTKYPTPFSEIYHLYLGTKGEIIFNNSYNMPDNCISKIEEKTLKKQILSLFELFQVETALLKDKSVTELFIFLEQLILDKVLKH